MAEIKKLKPTLHVEILQKKVSKLERENVISQLHKFIFEQDEISFGYISSGLSLSIKDHVQDVRICESPSINSENCSKIDLYSVNLEYHVYKLETDEPGVEEMNNGEEEIAAATHWCLPNNEFHELWDSLVYEDNIKDNLLNFIHTTLLFSDSQVNKTSISWNNVVLLHGPPGTGKTSLCKALAQKIAIRLDHRYKCFQLIEVNSHSLFSKWFSESGKLVQQLFTEINELLEDKDSLVIVLIDEVESLSRDRTKTSSSEPSDGLRVVNALLTQIDQLKRYNNALILTTSNISDTIDLAFVDRADIKQYIGLPSAAAIYQVYQSCIIELIKREIIQPGGNIFSLNELKVMKFQENNLSRPSLMLSKLSEKSVGLSGRTLRKIPFLAHALFLQKPRTDILEYISAMEMAVSKQFTDMKMITGGIKADRN